MISVADKQAELEKFEWLQCIKNDVDEFRVDIFKLRNLRTIIDFFLLFTFIYSNQRLVAFELAKELINWGIDDGDYVDNFLHDFILDKDISLSLNDLHINIIVLLFIINYWILGVQFMSDFWDWVLDPKIIRIDHGFDALEIRFKIILVFGVELAETWLNWFEVNVLWFWLFEDNRGIRSIQISKWFINTHNTFLFVLLFVDSLAIIQCRKWHRILFHFLARFFLSKLLINWLLDIN